MILQTGKKTINGILLLEVMLSFAILFSGIVLILSSSIRSLRLLQYSQDSFKAVLLAEKKIWDMTGPGLSEGFSTTGIFDDFNKRICWSLDIKDVLEEPFKELSLIVSWEQSGKKQDILVQTYV